MAMTSTTSVLLSIILVLHLVTATISYPIPAPQPVPVKKYCIPKPGVDDYALQANIDFVCSSGVDCKPIQPGGACFEPNTLQFHATYAMNSYYNVNGRNNFNCYFSNTGLLSVVNQSYDNCIYL